MTWGRARLVIVGALLDAGRHGTPAAKSQMVYAGRMDGETLPTDTRARFKGTVDFLLSMTPLVLGLNRSEGAPPFRW